MKSFLSKIVLFTLASCGFFFSFVGKKTTNQAIQSSNNPSTSSDNSSKGVAVLELFTSEGCSSCPPADDILRGVSKQENVFALSFHVTYWNRLGWKDSFSQKIFDERQYNYGSRFQKEGVYTPQLVVNGTDEFVGSRKTQTDNAIKKALSTPVRIQIELSKSLNDNDIIIKYKLSGDYNNANMHFAVVESNFTTKVIRGENEGRILKHDNVVRDFETLALKNTPEKSGQIDGVHEIYPLKNWLIKNCSLIVFVQDKKTGQVIGASKIGLN